MKMPGYNRVISVFGDQDDARRVEESWRPGNRKVNNIDEAKKAKIKEQLVKEKVEATETPKQVKLDENRPDQTVLIGSQLNEREEQNLVTFLRSNRDVFAWSAKDLCGISRDIIEHALNVDPSVKPRKQKLSKMSEDRAEGAKSKVNRLLEAEVIRPIKYPERLANVIMAKKPSGKW